MAWLYVPLATSSASARESAGSTSGSGRPAVRRLWCSSSGKPLLLHVSSRAWKRRPWRRLLSGTTLPRSTLRRGVASWIASLAARRARTSLSPERDADSMGSAPGSSSSTSASPWSARPRFSSGRTSPVQLVLFPPSASTSREGATAAFGPSFARVTWTRHKSAPASSYWPTPSASDDRATGYVGMNGQWRPGLRRASQAWQAQCASDTTGPRSLEAHTRRTGSGRGPQLKDVVHLWPTATATDARASGAAGYSTASGRHSGTTLTDAAVRQGNWPTASRYGSNRGGAAGRVGPVRPSLNTLALASPSGRLSQAMPTPGPASSPADPTSPPRFQLNPSFVEWLMGLPEGWTLPYVRTVSRHVATVSSPPKPPWHGSSSGTPLPGAREVTRG
jgi:hypothetical protein